MLIKILIIILAFFMMVYGFSFILIYINLFSFGYNINEYIMFIIKRYEFYIFIIGLLIELYYIVRKEYK